MIIGKAKNIGERIRLLRLKNQWTQEEISKRLYISIPAYSKIETGITDVNLSRLEQIATIFNMTLAELLDLNDRGKKNFEEVELEELRQLLRKRSQEVMDLQKKMIHLYEELRNIRVREKL